MTLGARRAFQIALLIGVAAVLFFAFPAVIAFVEGAALSIRRFWWVILLLALSAWVALTLRQRNR